MSIRFVSSSLIQSSSFWARESGSESGSFISSAFYIVVGKDLGEIKGDFNDDKVKITLSSQSFGGSSDIDVLTISASNSAPRVGIGVTNPIRAFDFKETRDDNRGGEILIRSSRTTKGAEVGDEAGRLNFVIDSASYNDIETSGSVAQIVAKVTNENPDGVFGGLSLQVADSAKNGSVERIFIDPGTTHITGSVAVSSYVRTTAQNNALGSLRIGSYGSSIDAGDLSVQGGITLFSADSDALTVKNGSIYLEDATGNRGHITASGNISSSGNVYATEFHGDGSNLTNLPSQTDENFTTADHSKLDGIEANADVTDATNVQAAGALMDSEVTSLSLIKGLTAAQISGAFDATSASLASDIPTNNNQLTNGAGYTTNTGTVDTTGTPANNQIAIFTDADTIEGDSDFTWNGTTLDINGQVDIDEARSSDAIVDINNTYSGIMSSAHYALKVTGGQANGTPGSAIKAYGGYFTAGNTNGTNPDTIALYAQGHEDGAPNSYAAIFSGSAGGVVGINTLEPTVELEVSGDGKFSGTLEIGGISDVSASIAAAGGGGGSGTVTEVTVGTGLDVTNGTTTPNITLDLTEITLSNGLDSTATGLSLDLTEVIASDGNNLLLTSDGDGTLSAENITVSQGRMQFNDGDTSQGVFGIYTDLVNDIETATTIFTGDIADIGTAITTTAGYVCNLSGSWAAAQANSVTTSTGLLGIAVSSASSNRFLLRGYTTIINTDFQGTFVAGAPIYLSAGNAGKYNFSPPSSTGDVSRVVGHAIETVSISRVNYYKIYFNPSPDWIEL